MTQFTLEIALVESRGMRELHLDHIAALDRAKPVAFLPGDVYVTVEMAASYFDVNVETIKKITQRHSEELESNGLRTLRGAELRELKGRDKMSLPLEILQASQLTVLNRRALLNVAMLLRDSEVARQVRYYLLNVEELTDDSIRRAAVARRSERIEYRYFRDLMSSNASDYAASSPEAQLAFAAVQNALYRSIVGMTAKQLKASGREIQVWSGKRGPTSQDREVAKNFLTEQELKRLQARVGLLCAKADVLSADGETLTLGEWRQLVERELPPQTLTA